MKSVHYMRYTFGHKSSEDISTELVNLYRWIANSLTGEEGAISPDNLDMTIPSISEKEIPEIRMSSHIINYIEKQWKSPLEVVVIDVARATGFTPIRGGEYLEIATAITSKLSDARSKGQDPLFIFLKHIRGNKNDPDIEHLSHCLEKGSVIILDDSGRSYGRADLTEKLDSNAYKLLRTKTEGSVVDRIRYKFIRRLGHFHDEGGDGTASCSRHFFDGSACKTELVDLIRTHLKNKSQSKEKPTLFCGHQEVDWFRSCIISLSTEARIVDLDSFFENKIQLSPAEIGENPFLIIALVDTGSNLTRIMKQWNEKSLPQPNILAVASTKGSSETNGVWDILLDGRRYGIEYILKVKRNRYLDKCPMCSLEIPFSRATDDDDYFKLTTYDFWDMAENHPCEPESESEIPLHRMESKGLRTVPPIRQMIHDNGPWLAWKAIELVKRELGNDAFRERPIVYPSERGAEALPLYLREMEGASLIPIPDRIRNALCSEKQDIERIIEQLNEDNPTCFQQLESVDPGQPVVLLEEFSLTGGTRKALSHLVAYFERRVLFHFCLVSFEPETPDSSEKRFHLYSFGLLPPKGPENAG